MKRLLAAVLAMVLLLSCTACGAKNKEIEMPVENVTELTLWTYPYGNWSDSETLQ